MKKRFAILFAITILLLSACSKQTDNHETEPSTTQAKIAVKEYPGDRDIAKLDSEYALTKELFETIAEENGKAGVLYTIYGTVENYIKDDDEGIAYLRVSTNHGDVIIYDPLFLYETNPDQGQTYSESELKRMREYYPIPDAGEFVLIYGEYLDTSSYFGCPLFIYGGKEYFVNVCAAASEVDNNLVAPETENTDTVKSYPGDAAGDMLPKYAEPLSEIVFTTTGEDNGLIGNSYMLMGTVERYVEKPDGYPIYIEISTLDGDVMVMDPVEFLKYDTTQNTMLSEAGLGKLREFYPLPDVGEFVVLYAEYQGMSGVFECPAFLYGTTSYMVNTLVAVSQMGDEYVIE